jgi:uncharacterized protein
VNKPSSGAEADRSQGDHIDACAFHEWASNDQLVAHMDAGWQEVFQTPVAPGSGHAGGTAGLRVSSLYTNPRGGKDPAAYPAKGPAGSEATLLRSQLAVGKSCSRVVLGFDEGLLMTAYPDPYVARTAVRAANEWTAAEWLDPAAGVFGLILVAGALPEDAATEIRRLGRDGHWVGVALGANSIGLGFGHPVYRPILAAAAEMGLPVVIQTNSDVAATLMTPPVAGGLPTTFAEYKSLSAESSMSHLAGMILGGVFSELPSLQVLVVGGGVSWVPGFLWRHDYYYKIEAHEAPWLDDVPSEYFRRHVKIATYPLEAADSADRIVRILETVPWLESSLLFASGYPNYDWQDPDIILDRIPATWRRKVLHDNAIAFYRWPDKLAQAAALARPKEEVN